MAETIVVLTPEEAAADGVRSKIADQVKLDMARAEVDLARANSEVEKSSGVPASLIEALDNETAAAKAMLAELEKDATAKGIPLAISGSRYRIYVTSPSES